MVEAMIRSSECLSSLFLEIVLDVPQQPRPALTVSRARSGQLRQTAVRYFDVCTGRDRRQFPAHNCAMRRVLVPVCKPRIRQDSWRIHFENLAVMVECARDAI